MVEIIFPDVDLQNVKGLLIDLDDTIYSYENAHELAMIKCHELFQKQIDKGCSLEKFSQDYRQYRNIITKQLLPLASCRSRLLAFQIWFENLGVTLPYSKALEFDSFYWDSLLKETKINPKALQLLQKCHHLKIPVCIVTDMTAQQQMQKIQKLNIEQYVAALVTSEEVGVEKPDHRMFKAALAKIKVLPSEAIMIGDHPLKDIASAEQLGLKTYKVN